MRLFILASIFSLFTSQPTLAKEMKLILKKTRPERIKLTSEKPEEALEIMQMTNGPTALGQCLLGIGDAIRILKEQGKPLEGFEITVEDKTERDVVEDEEIGSITIYVRGTSEHYKNIQIGRVYDLNVATNECNQKLTESYNTVIEVVRRLETEHAKWPRELLEEIKNKASN